MRGLYFRGPRASASLATPEFSISGPGRALARGQPPERPASAVTIINDRTYFSGTLLEQGYVATVAHAFREGTGQVIVATSNGNRYLARVEGIDEGNDLALLRVRTDGLPDPAPLAEERPSRGAAVVSCGYASGVRSGTVLGYNPDGWLVSRLSMRQGDSGSGILCDGKLVGVAWGGSDKAYASHAGPIRKLLDRCRSRKDRPSPPAAPPQAPAGWRPVSVTVTMIEPDEPPRGQWMARDRVEFWLPRARNGLPGRDGAKGDKGDPGAIGETGDRGLAADERRVTELEKRLGALESYQYEAQLYEADGKTLRGTVNFGVNKPLKIKLTPVE